jgi:hypothetical protein
VAEQEDGGMEAKGKDIRASAGNVGRLDIRQLSARNTSSG